MPLVDLATVDAILADDPERGTSWQALDDQTRLFHVERANEFALIRYASCSLPEPLDDDYQKRAVSIIAYESSQNGLYPECAGSISSGGGAVKRETLKAGSLEKTVEYATLGESRSCNSFSEADSLMALGGCVIELSAGTVPLRRV